MLKSTIHVVRVTAISSILYLFELKNKLKSSTIPNYMVGTKTPQKNPFYIRTIRTVKQDGGWQHQDLGILFFQYTNLHRA